MILKLLLLIAFLYVIYRLFGGKIENPFGKKSKEDKDIEQNTLVECCKCGVYITKKEATKKGECFYCEECV